MATDVYILAGFLGAGKTSALRHIISQLPDASDCLAIVNEAGALGLDGKLVERAGLPVRELRNGCICCSLQVDFIKLLDELFKSVPPGKVFMEASGLADVNKLAKALERFSSWLGFRKIVVILDAAVWEIRTAMGGFFYSQLSAADLIALNKTDLYPGEAIEKFLVEIRSDFPGPELTACSHGQIDAGMFLEHPEKKLFHFSDRGCEFLDSFKTFSFASETIVSADLWDSFLRKNGGKYERIKGQLALNSGQVYFDYARGRAERQEPLEGLSGSRLVFIGQNIDEDELKGQLSLLFSS